MAANAVHPLPAPASHDASAGGPGRFRRVLEAAVASVGLSAVFGASLVTAVALHLDTAPSRSVVRSVANLALGELFQGKIVVGEIDRLDLHGLAIRSAVAVEPGGTDVARIAGLRAEADLLRLGRSAVFGSGDLDIVLPLIHIDTAEAVIEKRGAAQVPTIAETFVLRSTKPPPPPGGRRVRVALERIEIGHVVVNQEVAAPKPGAAQAFVDDPARDIQPIRSFDESHLMGVGASVHAGGPEGVLVDVESAQLDGHRPVPQPVSGVTTYRLRVGPGGAQMEATFDGYIGDLESHLAAKLDGKHVSATIDVPRATAEAIAGFFPAPKPDLLIRVPAAVRVEADGDLPEIAIHDLITFEDHRGAVSIDGRLVVDSKLRVDVAFKVHDLDPRVLLDEPSATPLQAAGRVWIEGVPPRRIMADVTTEPFAIRGIRIPAVDAHAALLDGGVVQGNATVHEVGAPTAAAFWFSRDEGLRFDVETRAASLAAIARLRAPVDGAASVRVTGTLQGGTVEAKVQGRFGAIQAPGGVALEDGGITGRVHGPVASPQVDAAVWGKGMRAGGYAWETVNVRAFGPALAPRVETKLDAGGGESIEASGSLDPKGAALRDVSVQLTRAHGVVGGRVERVAATPGGVSIEGLKLEGQGVGQLTGGLVIRHKEITGRLRGSDVDLGKVAKLAGIHAHLGGLANVDVDLSSSRPGNRKGHVNIELVNGELSILKGVSGMFSASFDGDKVKADGLVRLIAQRPAPGPAGGPEEERCDGAIAQVRLTEGGGALPGAILDPASWTKVSGRIQVSADDWNLRCLARAAGVDALFSEIRGKLSTRAVISRKPEARLPSVRDFVARTRGLSIASAPEWDSRSTDVKLEGKFSGNTGDTDVKVTLLDHAEIASVGLKTTLDLATLLDHPERRLASLRSAALSGEINVPRRAVSAFASLPSFVRARLPPLAGEVQLSGSLSGSLDQPSVKVQVDGWDLAHASTSDVAGLGSPWGIPLDLDATATYDGSLATLAAHVKHDGKQIAEAGAGVKLGWADVLAGRAPKPTGEIHATITEAPLGEVPFFSDRDIGGHLNGKLTLTGFGTRPELAVDLDVPDLRFGQDLFFDRCALHVGVPRPAEHKPGDGHSTATASLELVAQDGGKLDAGLISDVIWQGGLVPVPEEKGPERFSADLKAERFRIAALGPFMAGIMSRIDGHLDGKASVGWTREDKRDGGKISVEMKLSEGIFNLPQLGQEFHGAELSIKSGPGGKISFDGLRADGTRGRITGSGHARFAGLRFEHADATLSIAGGQEIPITLQGVPLGDAHGRITLAADKTDRALEIKVGVPELHFNLPGDPGRGVQGLEDNPAITVSHTPPVIREARAKDAPALVVSFDIGRIYLRKKASKGQQLEVDLVGVERTPLRVEITDRTRITGDIKFDRGFVEVMKKRFEIEQGVLHMRPEDPSNPYVNLTARWDTPDGQPIFIDYIGVLLPITQDKLKLRSATPGLGAQDLYAMLLLGGAGGSSAGGQTGGAQALTGQLLASQLSTTITGNLGTNITTNDDGSLRPGLTYTAGDKVIGVSTYEATGQAASGAASAGSAGGTASKGQHTVLTLDWRFWRNWLLRGKVDVGSDSQTNSGLDLLWQFRY